MKSEFAYGGQAVIEGVMMRGQKSLAISVRTDKGIVTQKQNLRSVGDRFPFLKWPILRGMVALIEAMVIGVKALNFSASQFAAEEEEELGTKEIVLTMGVAFLLTVGLFIVLPAFAIRLVQSSIHSNILLNLVEGLIKISIFIIYILAISFMPDIRRVFEYHGAEHKTINCYEAGEELTVENVQKHSTCHKRCGTSFILIVLMTSIFVFSFFGRPPFIERVLTHLAVLPIVAGISYEIIKRAGEPNAGFIVRTISTPGLWFQRLTTRQPDEKQVEVAINSLEVVLAKDHELTAVKSDEGRFAV